MYREVSKYMKIEVTKLELIKLKTLLKKYKKNNLKKNNGSKLVTMGYNSVDISYLAINKFINEEVFYVLTKMKHSIEHIGPIKMFMDNIEYNTLNYNEIDNSVRLMLEKIGGMEVLSFLYDLLDNINTVEGSNFFIKSDLTNWDSIRKVLNFYKNNIKDYYFILNKLMTYNHIRINYGKTCEDVTFHEPITNTYFLRINDDKSIFKNVILSHEFMHVILSKQQEHFLFSETKPIMAEKLYIKSLIQENNTMYNGLYFNRINDTFDKIYKLKCIYEFLKSYDIENNHITKENIDSYRKTNNISVSQILDVFASLNYNEVIGSLEYIYGDIVSNMMFQNYDGVMSNIEKYHINDNNIKDIFLKMKKTNYIEEYNSFIKSIK